MPLLVALEAFPRLSLALASFADTLARLHLVLHEGQQLPGGVRLIDLMRQLLVPVCLLLVAVAGIERHLLRRDLQSAAAGGLYFLGKPLTEGAPSTC